MLAGQDDLTHLQLGGLTPESCKTWKGQVFAPAFNVFGYCRPRGWAEREDVRPPDGRYSLTIDGLTGTDRPPPEAIAMVVTMLDRQDAVVPALVAGLWADLTGTGLEPECAFGSPDELARSMGVPPPAGPDDLRATMRLTHVYVRLDFADDCGGPVIQLCFEAAIEEEHGLGVLTDGHRVLGTGMGADVPPYGWSARQDKDG